MSLILTQGINNVFCKQQRFNRPIVSLLSSFDEKQTASGDELCVDFRWLKSCAAEGANVPFDSQRYFAVSASLCQRY